MSVIALREDLGGRLHREAVCLFAGDGGGLRVVLADGRGGMVSGGPAAELVATAMLSAADEALAPTLIELHHRVAARNADPAEAARQWVAMTCSAAAVHLQGERLRVAQIGDVRVYCLPTGGPLTLLTADQTLAALQGVADAPREDPRSWSRAVLVEQLGAARAPSVNTRDVLVRAGDRILVTSSALPRQVPDATLGACLARCSLEDAADALRDAGLDALRQRGETGNVTLAVIEVA